MTRGSTAADSSVWGSADESAPTLAQATAELRDAQHALDKAISFWWEHSPEEGVEIARRWWIAREVFRDAIAGEK